MKYNNEALRQTMHIIIARQSTISDGLGFKAINLKPENVRAYMRKLDMTCTDAQVAHWTGLVRDLVNAQSAYALLEDIVEPKFI
jgi:hypothetical protein